VSRCSAVNKVLLIHTSSRCLQLCCFKLGTAEVVLVAVLLVTAGATLTVIAGAVQLIWYHSTANVPAVMLAIEFC